MRVAVSPPLLCALQETCLACKQSSFTMEVSPHLTLETLLEMLETQK